MDKNIVAALIIGTVILLQPLIEESSKDYKWRIMGDREHSAPNSSERLLWFYTQEECEKQLAAAKRRGLADGESCVRFPR